MLFASTSLWVVSGLVASDYFVAVINIVGVVLSCWCECCGRQ
jgi:hypothetical protein